MMTLRRAMVGILVVAVAMAAYSGRVRPIELSMLLVLCFALLRLEERSRCQAPGGRSGAVEYLREVLIFSVILGAAEMFFISTLRVVIEPLRPKLTDAEPFVARLPVAVAAGVALVATCLLRLALLGRLEKRVRRVALVVVLGIFAFLLWGNWVLAPGHDVFKVANFVEKYRVVIWNAGIR